MEALTEQQQYCPVSWMREWLACRARWAVGWTVDAGWLFCSREGRPLSSNTGTHMIKALAKATLGDDTGFSGHCLRIGGASRMYEAGYNAVDIQLVGGWTSDATVTRSCVTCGARDW